MSLRSRVSKLGGRDSRLRPEDCPRRPSCILFRDEPVPDHPRSCPWCGVPHVLRIVTRVVARTPDGRLVEVPRS
jgi:hypothetical protein